LRHGPVDVIGAPDGLAQALMQMAGHPYIGDLSAADPDAPPALMSDWQAWGRILTLLQRTTGVDFSAYKPSTIQRRIARRMALRNLEQPHLYAQDLETKPEEVEALYHDLLIKVTAFFREPESFDALAREVLPHMLAERRHSQPLRIWVPGCATGKKHTPWPCASPSV
jgi:two-component system CheB/CheR fusion protein